MVDGSRPGEISIISVSSVWFTGSVPGWSNGEWVCVIGGFSDGGVRSQLEYLVGTLWFDGDNDNVLIMPVVRVMTNDLDGDIGCDERR
jgi:hypothetical protein